METSESGAEKNGAIEPRDAAATTGGPNDPNKLSPKTVSNYTYGILSLANGAITVSVPMDDDYYSDSRTENECKSEENSAEVDTRAVDASSHTSPLPKTRRQNSKTRWSRTDGPNSSLISSHPHVRFRHNSVSPEQQGLHLASNKQKPVPKTTSDDEFPPLLSDSNALPAKNPTQSGNTTSPIGSTSNQNEMINNQNIIDGIVQCKSQLKTRRFANVVKKGGKPKSTTGSIVDYFFKKKSTSDDDKVIDLSKSGGHACHSLDNVKDITRQVITNTSQQSVKSSETLTPDTVLSPWKCTQSCSALDSLDELNVKTLQYLADEEPLPQRVGKRKRVRSGRRRSWSSDDSDENINRQKICKDNTSQNPPKKVRSLCDLSSAEGDTTDKTASSWTPLGPDSDDRGKPVTGDNSKIRCIDCKKSPNPPTNGCELCFILQTLATEIDIPTKANPSYRRAKWYLQTEGKLQTRATFLRSLASRGIVPRFALGMKNAPTFIPNSEEFAKKYLKHLQEQGEATLRFLAEALDEMAVEYGDDAKGYLVSVEHFYKEDAEGFDSCKNLLAAACHRDRANVRRNLKRSESKDQYRNFELQDIIDHLLDPNAETYTPDDTSFDAPLTYHPPSQKSKDRDGDSAADQGKESESKPPKKTPRKKNDGGTSHEDEPKRKSPREDFDHRSPLEGVRQTGKEDLDFGRGGRRKETGQKDGRRRSPDGRRSPDRRGPYPKSDQSKCSPIKNRGRNQMNPQEFCNAFMQMQRFMSMWNKGQ